MDYDDYLKKKKKESPTSLNIGADEETGNYYCPVDKNHNVIREKRKVSAKPKTYLSSYCKTGMIL
ncbi:hypothetical protein TUM19329_19100 [Legionella antarctica]|uniref:Uncharacterized protein n=1 Tax=Legionella antarctica TaxID=2708020 RepID=A0A6F8T525_9GAMM|nr:hypothetical protein [Legionella antarctica]BCA95549.1 hypothetical protein TUM19329_19100 [Legionella antarctica]